MGVGGSIALLVIGAILAFAVKDADLGGWLDIHVVGWVLIVAGLVTLSLTMWLWNRRRPIVERTVVPPAVIPPPPPVVVNNPPVLPTSGPPARPVSPAARPVSAGGLPEVTPAAEEIVSPVPYGPHAEPAADPDNAPRASAYISPDIRPRGIQRDYPQR